MFEKISRNFSQGAGSKIKPQKKELDVSAQYLHFLIFHHTRIEQPRKRTR